MISRCSVPDDPAYADYGGRGIRVCDRWKDFGTFYSDVGDSPEGKTIDRINNDGDYEPANIQWATRKEQALNRRNARMIEHNGERRHLSEWSAITGISEPEIYRRLKAGFPPSDALTLKKIRGLRGRPVTHNGRTMTPLQWAKELGIPSSRIRNRLDRGFSDSDALYVGDFGDSHTITGGRRGGLTKEQRSQQGIAAANKRWGNS